MIIAHNSISNHRSPGVLLSHAGWRPPVPFLPGAVVPGESGIRVTEVNFRETGPMDVSASPAKRYVRYVSELPSIEAPRSGRLQLGSSHSTVAQTLRKDELRMLMPLTNDGLPREREFIEQIVGSSPTLQSVLSAAQTVIPQYMQDAILELRADAHDASDPPLTLYVRTELPFAEYWEKRELLMVEWWNTQPLEIFDVMLLMFTLDGNDV